MVTDDEVKIVLNRLELMPRNLKLIVGDGRESLDKASLIQHVKDEDEIGQLVVEAHMRYLRSFKEKHY